MRRTTTCTLFVDRGFRSEVGKSSIEKQSEHKLHNMANALRYIRDTYCYKEHISLQKREYSPVYTIKIDTTLIRSALHSDDEIGIILRGHMLVERALLQACEKFYVSYSALGHRYSSQHLKALRARGATGSLFEAVHYVNEIRNKVAHAKIEPSLTSIQSEYTKLVKATQDTFPNDDILNFDFQHNNDAPTKIKDLPESRQFLLFCTMIASAVSIMPQRSAEQFATSGKFLPTYSINWSENS